MNTGFTLFICQRFLYWNEILQNNNIMTTSTIFMFIYLDTKIPPTLLLSNFFFSNAQSRSSYSEMFCKKVVFKSFLKLKGKHLCRILFLNKVWSKAAGHCRPLACNFIKKETPRQVLFCKFCEICKNNSSGCFFRSK